MDQILSVASIVSTAAVSIFSVALPAVLEHRRSNREFKYKRAQLHFDNKYAIYKDLIAAYSYPRFDVNRAEARLELKRAIFLAISVSDKPLADKLQNLLALVDEPAVSFHQSFQPLFLECLSMINHEYNTIIESLKP